MTNDRGTKVSDPINTIFMRKVEMDKMILEHVNIQEIPVKWAKLLNSLASSSYKITIEPESTTDMVSDKDKQDSWKNMPMFGMWKDRDEMLNPTEYVNKIRKPRF